jgi:hypothetical protein
MRLAWVALVMVCSSMALGFVTGSASEHVKTAIEECR